MKSCIYEGSVLHHRMRPTKHAFRYRMFQLYLDLAELPELFDGNPLWSARGPAVGWFRRPDYLGPADVPLDVAVRDRVERELGSRPTGPIRVLTHLRTFGYVFNPVTFYYVFDPADTRVESIVAEITNTPWKERHAYVLYMDEAEDAHRFAKEFHVSPFMPMDQEYRWALGSPGESLLVHMENHRQGEKVFEARLDLKRRALSRGTLNSMLWRYPLMTTRVVLAIHLQAFRLWRKGVPFVSHPAKLRDVPSADPREIEVRS